SQHVPEGWQEVLKPDVGRAVERLTLLAAFSLQLLHRFRPGDGVEAAAVFDPLVEVAELGNPPVRDGAAGRVGRLLHMGSPGWPGRANRRTALVAGWWRSAYCVCRTTRPPRSVV